MNKKISKKTTHGLKGEITIPSDKSISHRAAILCTLAQGTSHIKNYSKGEDPHTTLNICKLLGIEYKYKDNEIEIKSKGHLKSDAEILYCGNSGTTMRLMSGILACQNFKSILTGDESLSKRPMKRIIEPLTLMGATINSMDNHAPLEIIGQNLHGITYRSKLASAQVKSTVLLAGLLSEGKTIYTEPYLSRNHTELMLEYMGANINTNGRTNTITKSELMPQTIEIPGDISSAAYFMAAAAITPNSNIIIKNVGLNPTRTGIIDILRNMQADIEIIDERTISNERVGDIRVRTSELKSCEISGETIPRLIDEIPIISVIATQANGTTIIKDATDLRNKESDRITSIVKELKKLGANIEERADGIIIEGKTKLQGNTEVTTYRDHRLAMSLYIAGLICEDEILIKDFDWVNISFPEFESLFDNLNK